MKLRLSRINCDVCISHESIATLEIHDRPLFTRVVNSLLSGKGKYADEPYVLSMDDGGSIRTQGALLVVNSLPVVPLNDRTLIGKLYKRIAVLAEADQEHYLRLSQLSSQLEIELSSIASDLWGDYQLASEWNLDAYLKAYKLLPSSIEGVSLLENCIGLIDLCVDVAPETPLVLVNCKSFFSCEELEELFDHVFFSRFQLLLLESWPDQTTYSKEVKTVVDQHFIVFD